MTDTIRIGNDMPRAVILCGVSGSGKTHYARILESRGFIRLSPDLIVWEKYGASFQSLPFERQQPIFGEAFATLSQRFRELLAEGRDVVVDSTMCRREKRDAIRRICAEAGVTPEFIYFNPPLEVLMRRLEKRTGKGPDDQIVPPTLLERFHAGFHRPDPDETDIRQAPESMQVAR